MSNPLFARKPLALLLKEVEGQESKVKLNRVLTPVALTGLGIGAIIGTGIFVLTGVAAHDKTGPALILSFVAAAIACIFAAVCYSEFASMVPIAGSAYTYAYATLGELFAWIIGWDLVLEYAVSSAAVAHGWSKYFQDFLGIFHVHLPYILTTAPFDFDPARGAMGRDGLLPRSFFGAVHPKFQTPWKCTILTGIFVAILAAFLPLRVLADLVSIGTLLAFVIVCSAVTIMRYTRPTTHRPFRAPMVPLVPILGVLICLLLMFSLPVENWVRLFGWLLIGIVIYFAYGRRHSIMSRENGVAQEAESGPEQNPGGSE